MAKRKTKKEAIEARKIRDRNRVPSIQEVDRAERKREAKNKRGKNLSATEKAEREGLEKKLEKNNIMNAFQNHTC